MRARTLRNSLLVLGTLALLPIATDGGQAECCNAAGSLVSTTAGPVNGDEAFFKLPTGPANIMFLLDVSGSMLQLAPCGDNDNFNNSGTTGRCTSPTLQAPATPSATTRVTVYGSCAPSTGVGANPDLAWMEAKVPQVGYADPGRSNALLTDRAPWGNGCTGNNCLFDPDAYYNYQAWWASATGAGAYRRAHNLAADGSAVDGLPRDCTALDYSGNVINDPSGNPIFLGEDCRTCMNTKGFYFYRINVYNGLDSRGRVRVLPYGPTPIFRGTFLNANPPKFVSARKAIKDVAWMDPAIPSKLDKIRMGFAILDDGTPNPQRARLIVPLGPDKTNSFPPTQESFRQARQYILSVINYDRSTYTSGGTTVIDGNTITGGFFHPADGYTPLGSALLNVGQYFTSQNRLNALLGTGYQTSAFNESSAGLTNAPWARSNPNQCSICWGCQNNSVVVVTDGSPNTEITFPTAISAYDGTNYSAANNCGGTTTCGGAVLPRVADWLHNQDLRDDLAMSGRQRLTVHTIGIDIQAAQPVKILQATANLGGGIFQNVNDTQKLGDAVYNAINQVIPKEDSFSASAATSLQTMQTAASHAFLTRFKPNQSPTWVGHVFETFLFDERVAGCDPANPGVTVSCMGRTRNADFNGDGLCTGLFMVDSDCDQIQEDPATGDFVKYGTSTAANVAWDAGEVLSNPSKAGYRSADDAGTSARKIFTVVGGTKVDLTAANAATLLPYLNISPSWCSAFLTRIGITPTVGQERLTCAQQVIYFVRGWDVTNIDGDSCWGPGNPKNVAGCPSGLKGEERNYANDSNTSEKTFSKLGDIFHSSPAVAGAPVTETRCRTGYESQCYVTIFSPRSLPNQTPTEKYTMSDGKEVDAYEAYRQDQKNRKRIVLVGSNMGMLHAFDAGDPDFTRVDVTGQHDYQFGTGAELWAFVPPDLLPRLKDLIAAHQYMVDGSPMLRDVWVDGSGGGAKDNKKQRSEFHTMVVFGRRAGGNVWSALDVTDPLNPVHRWSFPDSSCGDDARYVGESWSEFAPRPAPIVPVRLASSSDSRGWEERWIVMINGGYDPMLTKGRAVFMVDVWTGKTVWRLTDPEWKAQTGYSSGSSMFPVPGAVALTDIGEAVKDASSDGFADTATWGDLGGNLFVARFYEPGKLDGSGRVTNWYAARAFEQRRQSDDSQNVPGRNEFYYMPSSAWDPMSGTLRAAIGSGNRERIMEQTSSCGTDNLLGCCQAGCTRVTSRTVQNYGACSQTQTFTCSGDELTFSTSSSCSGEATCTAPAPGAFSDKESIQWDCPGAGTSETVGTAYWDGSGLVTVSAIVERSIKGNFRAQQHNRFYSVWAYGGKRVFTDQASALAFDKGRFTDISFTGTCAGPTSGSCSLINTTSAELVVDPLNSALYKARCRDGSTRCQATSDDPGWYYEYGDYCPFGSCPSPPPWTDEKTGAGAQVIQSCLVWSSFRPVGATTSTDPCSGSLGTPVAYDYRMNWLSGTPDPAICGNTVAATQRAITSPPTTGIPRVTALAGAKGGAGGGGGPGGPGGGGTGEGGCAGGGVERALANLDPGSPATKTTISTQSCAVEPIYWMELSRDEHACRHVAPAPGAASVCK